MKYIGEAQESGQRAEVEATGELSASRRVREILTAIDERHAESTIIVNGRRFSARRQVKKKYTSCREVAEMFGVAPLTISRWVKAGILEALQPHGKHGVLLILVSSVERLLSSRES